MNKYILFYILSIIPIFIFGQQNELNLSVKKGDEYFRKSLDYVARKTRKSVI
jgi:hypothetical protein